MRRRDLVFAFAGAAVAPLAARAQQPLRMRRVGMLMSPAEDDHESMAWYTAFVHGLQQLGWIDGRNLRTDVRWLAGDPQRARKFAAELVALVPDVIMVGGSVALEALLQAPRAVPIVFAIVADPVGAGYVKSLARPGGNVTGFMSFEYSLSGKWPELLKEIAPSVKRVAVLRDAAIAAGIGQFAVIQSVAPSVGVDPSPIDVHDPREIERDVAAFADSANGGLIVTPGPLSNRHRNLIVALAARYKLPAIYGQRFYARGGGLISLGPNFDEAFRGAAGYVDRVLKGEKPAELPVQVPTRYELVINLKTANALGLTVPQAMQARADEVIE